MFEKFKWSIQAPESIYKDIVIQIGLEQNFDEKDFANQFIHKLHEGNYKLIYERGKNFPAVVSNDPMNKTYLTFDFVEMKGQTTAHEIKFMLDNLNECSGIKNADLVKEGTVYKLTNEEYRDYLIKNTRTITYSVLMTGIPIPNDRDEALNHFKKLGHIFAQEHALVREGIHNEGIDEFTANTVKHILTIEHSLGYLQMDKTVWEKYNTQNKINAANPKKPKFSRYDMSKD